METIAKRHKYSFDFAEFTAVKVSGRYILKCSAFFWDDVFSSQRFFELDHCFYRHYIRCNASDVKCSPNSKLNLLWFPLFYLAILSDIRFRIMFTVCMYKENCWFVGTSLPFHTHNYFRNLFHRKHNQIWIIITSFRYSSHQSKFRLLQNQSDQWNYNLCLV